MRLSEIWRYPVKSMAGERIAAAELLQLATSEQAASSLTDVADAAVEGALRVAQGAVDPVGAVDFSVIGMGRFGGGELGFGSDIDVMFVFEPRSGVDETTATRAATSTVPVPRCVRAATNRYATGA